MTEAPSSAVPGDKPLPKRKLLRLKEFDYSCASIYFITICCHMKRHLFGQIEDDFMILNNYGKMVEEEWWRCVRGYFAPILTFQDQKEHSA